MFLFLSLFAAVSGLCQAQGAFPSFNLTCSSGETVNGIGLTAAANESRLSAFIACRNNQTIESTLDEDDDETIVAFWPVIKSHNYRDIYCLKRELNLLDLVDGRGIYEKKYLCYENFDEAVFSIEVSAKRSRKPEDYCNYCGPCKLMLMVAIGIIAFFILLWFFHFG